MPDQPLQAGGQEDAETTTFFRLVSLPRWSLLQPPHDIGQLAFHRWALGHHIAFGVWRMLIDLLGYMLREGATERFPEQAAAWYDRYSVAQLYAGSCTPQMYAEGIRPRMAAFNPAFSGVWARDYERVIALLTELNQPTHGVLRHPLKRHRLVHMSLAALLVSHGLSLLKQTGRKASDPTTDSERVDAFFMVERRRVPTGQFRAQMMQDDAKVSSRPVDLVTHPVDFAGSRRST